MKRIVAIVMSIVMLLSMVPFVSAAETEQSEVEKDIAAMLFDGKGWDAQSFLDERDKSVIYLIAVDEQGFQFGKTNSAGYGLYLYLYNPSGIQINTSSKNNKVQMAVAFENDQATEFEKFDLKCVSATDDFQYMKFKVVDKKSTIDLLTMQERVAKLQKATSERLYEISGFELMHATATNAKDYLYGSQIRVIGYEEDKGLDGNNVNSKKITYKATQTLQLEPVQCYWRTQTSSLGGGHKNQINAAYFAVPNDVWDRYENINSILCEWYEYTTKPMIVTDDSDLYNGLLAMRGFDTTGFGVYPSHYSLGNGLFYYLGVYRPYAEFDFAYNVFVGQKFNGWEVISVDNLLPMLGWVLWSDEELVLGEECVSAQTVLDYYYENEDLLLLNSWADEGRTAGYNRFEVNWDTKFELKNYASNHGWLETILSYNIFNGGNDVNTKEEYDSFKPMEVFREGDSTTNYLLSQGVDYGIVADKHFLNDEAQAEDFVEYVKEAIANDCTVVMFRYAETDYFSETIKDVYPKIEGHAIMAQQTIFLDFDIIELKFTDASQNLVTIAVVSDPEDVVGGIQTPETSTDSDLVVDKYKKMLEDWWKQFSDTLGQIGYWVGIVLLILIIIALIPLGISVVNMLINAISKLGSGDKSQNEYRRSRQSRWKSNSWSRRNRRK